MSREQRDKDDEMIFDKKEAGYDVRLIVGKLYLVLRRILYLIMQINCDNDLINRWRKTLYHYGKSLKSLDDSKRLPSYPGQ